MTAVEWFANQLGITSGTMLERAKEMERLQLADAQSYAISNADMTNNRGYFDCDKWYAETYGSKGSDDHIFDINEKVFDQELFNYFSQEFNISLLGTEIQDIIHIVKRHTSSQTEISDEEIEEMLYHHSNEYAYGFKDAIKWYREQLKK